MFAGFRQMRGTAAEIHAIVVITRAVLRHFPAWAICAACGKIAQGRAGIDRRWPPSDAQICDVVEGGVQQRKKALADAETLLAGDVRTG